MLYGDVSSIDDSRVVCMRGLTVALKRCCRRKKTSK